MVSEIFGGRIANRLSMFFFVDLHIIGEAQTRVRVLNLSETGIGGVLGVDTSLAMGQKVSICFHGTLFVEGHVARISGDQVGIAFVERIELAQLRPRISNANKYKVPDLVKPAVRFWRPSIK